MRRIFITFILILLVALVSGCSHATPEEGSNIETFDEEVEKLPYLIISEINWSAPKVPHDLDLAASDYEWRIDLVNEQQGRLDLLQRINSGTKMDREEFKAWLDDLRLDTEEHIRRGKDAIYSGKNYEKQIGANLGRFEGLDDWVKVERERVKKNKEIITNDMNLNIDLYNLNVEIYNNWTTR